MAMVNKKTRKAIKKGLKKIINKHGPVIAKHIATALVAAVATYLGAEGKKGGKKLAKIAKNLPGGKKVGQAVAAAVPALKSAVGKLPDFNGHNRGSTHKSKKHASS